MLKYVLLVSLTSSGMDKPLLMIDEQLGVTDNLVTCSQRSDEWLARKGEDFGDSKITEVVAQCLQLTSEMQWKLMQSLMGQ